MISITRLCHGARASGDGLRYERPIRERKPIVVWNCTRTCNLRCVHCYSESRNENYSGELTTAEAKTMIEDLAAYSIPVLLFSGGEPMIRRDLVELGGYARDLGIRAVISTNGTLLDETAAVEIKSAGFSYVGISLDGIGQTNDVFRGVPEAFDAAVGAFEACNRIGQKAGLRLTLTRSNVRDLPGIFDMIKDLRIPRACFYHLVYTGRGSEIAWDDLTHEESRAAVDLIMERTARFAAEGVDTEILTVDNHCDGPYIYMRLLREDPERAEQAMELLKKNGGNASGIAIACIDNVGDVHPDQFWRECVLGNVRESPFSGIWSDESNSILAGLRHRGPLITGRCARSNCRWFGICNGNFRARALAVHGDPWGPDPACYLSDEEITLSDAPPEGRQSRP